MSTRRIIILMGIVICLLGCGGSRFESNQWTLVSRDEKGARRSSSFRYVDEGGYFLLWGFMGYVTEYYGNPEEPPAETPEYDLVYFDPEIGRWQNQLPFDKEEDWGNELPPLHMCSSYQGITTGSHRPQLKLREGVLRPDLNVVFDQVAYDSKRKRMVYFTGGRTFAYDVVARAWSDIGGGGETPPPVLGGSLAYDPDGDKIVLSGGGNVAEEGPEGRPVGFTGTWVYDCSNATWARADSGLEPPPRMASRLVYDSGNKVMVVFGGDGQSHYLSDTWIYDPATGQWRQSRAKGSPPPRAGHFTVFDPGTGWVVVGGGYNRQDLNDLWAFDVATDQWRRLRTEVPTGWYVTADIDPASGLIVLTTSTKPEGDTMTCNEIYSVRTTYALRFEGDELVDQSFSPVVQEQMPKRSEEETTTGTAPNPERAKSQAGRLRELPENRWVLLGDPGRAAPVRTWGSCSFDSRRGRIVYWGGGHCGYGGNDYDFYDVGENTWISKPLIPDYPERAWDKGINPAGVSFRGGPWIRHGRKAYAYDPVSDRVINMKGIYLTAGYEPDILRTYEPVNPEFGSGEEFSRSSYVKWVTWSFDPEEGTWETVCSGRLGLDLTVTTPKGVMAVDYNWGGLDTGNLGIDIPFEQLPVKENAVFLLDVAAREWRKLSSEQGPWPQNLYEMTSLVYDSARDQLILHGGGPNRDELWAFSLRGGSWRKLEPTVAGPGGPPECRREAVYLPGQDVVLTAGYPHGKPEEASLYAYSVGRNRWDRVQIPAPEGRTVRNLVEQNRGLTYDAKRNLVLMVLGERGGDVGRAVVYALRYNHATAAMN